jgi:uncharacterized membrane protein
MVFGLALSLGAFVLISQPPITSGPVPQNRLYFFLIIFGFSFVILVSVWNNYASIMAVLPLETRGLVVLNLVLLFAVTLEPYLLYVVAFYGGTIVGEPASVLYAIDLAVMNGILAGFVHVLLTKEHPSLSPEMTRKMRTVRTATAAMSVFFVFTILPVFWSWMIVPGLSARVILWSLTLPVGWVVRLLSQR